MILNLILEIIGLYVAAMIVLPLIGGVLFVLSLPFTLIGGGLKALAPRKTTLEDIQATYKPKTVVKIPLDQMTYEQILETYK